jgi:hypothetical protein
MATRFVLTPESAHPVTGSTFPELNKDAQDRFYLAFDASADEIAEWGGMIVPQSVTGTWTALVYYYMASATSGSVRGQAAVEAITPGDAVDMDSASTFDTANSAGDTVPGTGQNPDVMSITLTNLDSAAAGDLFRFRFNRDADGTSGTDDATGDMRVISIELRDAA